MPRGADVQVDVQVDEQFRAQVRPESIRQAAIQALAHQRVEGWCELVVVVAGDEVLRDLNLRHRDVDTPTDVLAFPDEPEARFIVAPAPTRYLGDVIISFPRASAQAAEAGHDVDAELQLLVVHGVLHLLGYDDQAEAQREEMWSVQSEILQALGVEANPPV
jgi:probable rRNA maturation factor